MKVLGIVKKVLPLIEGQSDNGNFWEKQTVVVANGDEVLAIEFMGQRRTKGTKQLKEGQPVAVTYNVRCNEYLDKWYTRLEGTSIVALDYKYRDSETPADGERNPMPPAGEDLPY